MSFSDNPGFDFETTQSYDVWIQASSGVVASNPFNLTVDINNIAEAPVVAGSLLESTANASENSADGTLIYQVFNLSGYFKSYI